MDGLFHQIIRYQNFPKTNPSLNNFSFDVIVGQKAVNMAFSEDLCYVRFCVEINFVLLAGSDKIRSLSLGFVMKLNTPEPTSFCGTLKYFRIFCYISALSGTFFEKFNTFWYNMEFLYI
jgi:hypothetical protein